MDYNEFLTVVREHEKENELCDCIYFGAVKKLEQVQNNLNKLDDVEHLRRVIKPFLIQWGLMARNISREDLDWLKLGESIRSLESDFALLRKKMFLTIDFGDKSIDFAVKNAYDKIYSIKNIGPTSTSKILHLLNPEIFVMWDEEIKKKYRKHNNRINSTSKGYLEFLKFVQKQLNQLFCEHFKETGISIEESQDNVCSIFNKTIARLIDEYNWSKAHPV